MELLIKEAVIHDKNSKWNGKRCDVFIKNGKIDTIADSIEKDGIQTIHSGSLKLSPGWLDLRAFFGEPGFEYKEDLRSGAQAAANGGFTAVAIVPSTDPIIDNKGQIEYIKRASEKSPVSILPIGALSEKLEGKNFTEIYDMLQAGAVAFSDDKNGIQSSGLIIRSLQYAQPLNAVIMLNPCDEDILHGGKMNEGVVSTQMGLKGMPSIAEEVMIERDIKLAQYCDYKVHFTGISTAESVEIIRQAKANGAQVTCDVALPNIIWNETILEDFDTNFKLSPPLRTETDRLALIAGLKDGTIDCIVSDHRPETIENKFCEFDYASFGMSTIETAFSLINDKLTQELDIDLVIEKLCFGSRQIINQDIPVIEEGNEANITLFDTDKLWNVDKKDLKSKSRNNPMIGEKLKGRVVGIVNNNQYFINE